MFDKGLTYVHTPYNEDQSFLISLFCLFNSLWSAWLQKLQIYARHYLLGPRTIPIATSTENKIQKLIVSRLRQITKMSKDARSKSASKYNFVKDLNRLAQLPNKERKQQLAPKNPKIVLNSGGNPIILQNIPLLLQKDPAHFMELIGRQSLGFRGDLHTSHLGNQISSSHSLTPPSVINDLMGDRNEYEQKHDESIEELQHDMLANAKLQEELEDCLEKSGMLTKQLTALSKRI